MKKSILLLFLPLMACHSLFLLIPLEAENLPATPAKTVAVSYADSVFQERFMSIPAMLPVLLFTLPIDIVTAGHAGATEALTAAVYKPSQRTATRQEASDYEKLLGDFDVHADFNQQLRQKLPGCSGFAVSMAADPQTAEEIIKALQDPDLRNATRMPPALGQEQLARFGKAGSRHVIGLKFSYGLGARAGSEQFGFTKNYRPFVKLIGVMIDTEPGKVIWRDLFIVFGPKGYRGSAADVENLDGGELAATFRELNAKLAGLIVNSLNRNPLAPEDIPPLVTLNTKTDFTF